MICYPYLQLHITKEETLLTKSETRSNVLRSECDLNWLLPFVFGWPRLKFTVTRTFTKSFSFLNRVNILII